MTSTRVGRFPGGDTAKSLNPEMRMPSNRIFTNGVNNSTGKPIDADTAKSVIRVISVDYNIEANSKEHNTDEYDLTERDENPQLVVRRGQPFDISVKLNKPYNSGTDDLRIVFQMGDTPMISKGSLVRMILSDVDKPKEWGAKLTNQDKENLRIRIFTPPNCYVGKWKLVVTVIKKDGSNKKTEFRYSDESFIYILFNPWCSDDQVFFPDDETRYEYVLNEEGNIYFNKNLYIGYREWNFGQLEENVLDCAIYLLEKGHIKLNARGDPVRVARNLSAMTNCQDDDGVLVGNWSGEYEGGKSPTEWTGSAAILTEYYSSKQPVKYGQCWVFSGVLTTLCRALGIPARSITNFSSAHDTDGSITIDKFRFEGDDTYEDMGDSVWNFHVWNDVWMARPDQKSGYGGWQAIDATPQEKSDGLYQCGPVPLAAIKYGDMESCEDAKFLYAEVNADMVNWQFDENYDPKIMNIKSNRIGTKILTSNLSREFHGEDITAQYKLPEGSEGEKSAKGRAYKNSSFENLREMYVDSEDKDFKFEMIQDEVSKYGKPFEVQLRISNQCDEVRTLGGTIKAYTVYQTGLVGKKIGDLPFSDVTIKPKTCENYTLRIPFELYDDKLLEYCHINTTFVCRAKETNKVSADDESFVLEKPKLNMKVLNPEVKVGQKFKVEMSFKNPVNKKLTGCRLTVESPKVQKSYSQNERDVVGNGTFATTVTLTAGKKPKTRTIIAVFNSKELLDITGSCKVKIIE